MKKKQNVYKWLVVVLGTFALLGFGFSPAFGENPAVGDDDLEVESEATEKDNELDWGTAGYVSVALSASSFQGYDASHDSRRMATGSNVYCSSGCSLYKDVQLPSGALIWRIELNSYDVGSSAVILFFNRCPDSSSGCIELGRAQSSGTGGYGFFYDYFSHTVNNYYNSYQLGFYVPGGTSYRVVNARVYYQLQVSPKPGSVTFGDVPYSSSYHRFVEALARSGITGGCGGGNFCPEQYVKRKEMAVFLSKALGLHWPN